MWPVRGNNHLFYRHGEHEVRVRGRQRHHPADQSETLQPRVIWDQVQSAIYLNFNSNDAQHRDLNKESSLVSLASLLRYATPYFDIDMEFQFMSSLR